MLMHSIPMESVDIHFEHAPRVDCEDRVVATLTTIPERINLIDATIKSLLHQSRSIDQINVCIPYESRLPPYRYTIPGWLQSSPKVKIVMAEKDYGPSTKLIPTWKTEEKSKNTRIIIVDDDEVYPYDLFKTLVEWSNKLPKSAVGCSGVAIPCGLMPSQVIGGHDDWVQNLRLTAKNLDHLARVDYLFGYAGLIVRAGFFDINLQNYDNSPSECFFEDDLWISGNLKRNHIDRFVLPAGIERMMPAANKKTLSTRALCLNENRNLKNMDIVFSHLFRSQN